MTSPRLDILIIPASPALVTELAPQDHAARKLVAVARDAVASALADRPDREVHIVGSQDSRWRTGVEGSFAAWGAPDVNVGAGHYLAELVGRYVLGTESAKVTRSIDHIPGDLLAAVNPPLILLLLDGPAGLTQRAPLSLIPEGPELHRKLQSFLGDTGDTGDMGDTVVSPATHIFDRAELSQAGIVEPDLWIELAEWEKRAREVDGIDIEKRLLAEDCTHGVGRYVARWSIINGHARTNRQRTIHD